MLDTQKVLDYSSAGMKPKDIAEKLSTEDNKVTHQAISKIIRDNKVEEVEVVPSGVQVFHPADYAKYSVENGRTEYGGEIGKKLNPHIEEVRALINSHVPPSEVMKKFQFSKLDLQLYIRKLSQSELRDKDIVCNFEKDFFR